MPRDILGEFGPERAQGARVTDGGKPHPRDVNDYAPPQGPSNINDAKSPGLHGHNCGHAGSQGASATRSDGGRGSPGLHGTNHGNAGSQGRR